MPEVRKGCLRRANALTAGALLPPAPTAQSARASPAPPISARRISNEQAEGGEEASMQKRLPERDDNADKKGRKRREALRRGRDQ
eukprot:3586910-Rhodomonas_salina.1